MNLLKRMWVNQPSTLQPYHWCHGALVIFDKQTNIAYFADPKNPWSSTNIYNPDLVLSDGWPKHLHSTRSRQNEKVQ